MRPDPASVTTEAELRRWYWLRSELVGIARALEIPTSGAKLELTERIAAALAGRDAPPVVRRPPARHFAGELGPGTVLPAGQRCTQELRTYLRSRIGPAFRFDGPMRAIISAGGVTVADVVDHWHATRDRGSTEVAPQFEYNRFTRAWRAAHPEGDRSELLAAWWEYRSAPR